MRLRPSFFVLTFVLPSCVAPAPPEPDLSTYLAQWRERSGSNMDLVVDHSDDASPLATPETIETADGLDRNEADALLWFANARIREARVAAGISAAAAANAGFWRDPSLDLNLEKILASVPAPWILGSSLGFEVPMSGRLEIEKSRTAAEHEAALALVRRVAWEERFALQSEWIRWTNTLDRIDVATTFLQRLNEVCDLANRLSDAGAIKRTDGRLFIIERATRLSELVVMKGDAEKLELALRSRIGLAPSAPVRLVHSSVDIVIDVPTDQRVDRLLGSNLRLAELRRVRAVAAEAWREQLARRNPDLGIAPGLGEEDGDTRALLGLSIPLPLWNRNRAGIAIAASELALADTRLQILLEEQIQLLAAAEIELNATIARRELIERDLLPEIATQMSELQQLADIGELSVLALLETLEREVESRIGWISAREAELIARGSIVQLLGPAATPRHDTSSAGDQP